MKYSNERPGGLSYLINFWSENIKLDKTGQEGLANTKQQQSQVFQDLLLAVEIL